MVDVSKLGPLPMNHPDMIGLLLDVERELVDWRKEGRGVAYYPSRPR